MENQSTIIAPNPIIAMKDSTAYMVTDILRDVLTIGTGKEAAVTGLDIAGKTGTTNFADKEGAKDSWFAGYTTNYTIAAWGGYQDRSPMKNFSGERYVPQDLFKASNVYNFRWKRNSAIQKTIFC